MNYNLVEGVTGVTTAIGRETWWQSKIEAELATPELRISPRNGDAWKLDHPRALDRRQGENFLWQGVASGRMSCVAQMLWVVFFGFVVVTC